MGSGPLSLAAQFASTWATLRMPGMTVLTAGCERQKRRAASGSVSVPSCSRNFSRSARSMVSRKSEPREVAAAEIIGRELLVFAQPASEPALVEGHPRDEAHLVLGARREQRVLRALIEDVVDHLQHVDLPRGHHAQRGLRMVAVDADADGADLPFAPQGIERIEPGELVGPSLGPYVELHERNAIHAQVAQALLRHGAHVVFGEHLVDRHLARGPLHVLRRHLARHVQAIALGVAADERAHDALALPHSIHERGVEEGHAELDRAGHGALGLRLIDRTPHVAAELPGSEPDFADFDAGTTERAMAHDPSLPKPSAEGKW